MTISVEAKREPWTSTKLHSYNRATVFQGQPEEVESADTLWFDRPASKWAQAFPIGNGTFGAMVFGGIEKDVIQFNHLDLWLPPTADEKYLFGKLPDKMAEVENVRQLLFAGKAYEGAGQERNER